MTKGFPTLRTLEGLFSRVDVLMLHEVCVVNEVLPAHIAHIDSVPGVDSLVFSEEGGLTEVFPTMITLTRLLPRGRKLTWNYIGVKREALATTTAGPGLPFYKLSLKYKEV